jgi:hypothetical protein
MENLKMFKDYAIFESMEDDRLVKEKMITYINKNINKLTTEHKENIKDASKLIDVSRIIQQVKEWLIRSLPLQLSNIKSGVGGNKFASDFLIFIKGLIKKEIDSIGTFKKTGIKLLAPSKENYKSTAKDFKSGQYFDTLLNILDLGFAIGSMSQMKKYEDQVLKWSKGVTDELGAKDKRKKIKDDVIQIFYNFLYS